MSNAEVDPLSPKPCGDKAYHVCGSDRAWFGFTIWKVDVWFCSAHRADGQTLLASVAARARTEQDPR